MQEHDFWNSIRKIAQADPMASAPDESVQRGYAIFQPRGRSRLLTLKPAFGGMLRRGEPDKSVYELSESVFVEISHQKLDDGVRVYGFAAGIDSDKILLMGLESVFEAELQNGEFDFCKSIPSGCYAMTFQHQGESHWIRDLSLGVKN